MKYFLLPSLIVLFLFFSSCKQEEKLIDNTTDEWQLLVANNDGTPALSLYKMPELTLISHDIYFDSNGEKLVGDVTKIVDWGDTLYLFIPSAFRIEVIQGKTFKRIITLDYSAEQRVPSDICFPEGSNAYICHGNDSMVTIFDRIFVKKAERKIITGKNPVSIAASNVENKEYIYVANQGDNTVTVIHSNVIEAVIPVAPCPTFIEPKNDGKQMIVISLGNGKLGTSENKSAAIATFIDVEKKSIISTLDIGSSTYKAIDQVPKGFAVTNKDWAFVPSNDVLLKLNTRDRTVVRFVSKIPVTWIGYNNRRKEIIYLKKVGADSQVVTADVDTGFPISTFNLPLNITALQPM